MKYKGMEIKNITDSKLLEELSNLEDYEIKAIVADNPNTPSHILEKWYYNTPIEEYDELHIIVQFNPNIPVKILEEISNEKDEYDRGTIAYNISSPSYLLEKIADNVDTESKTTIVNHPNVTVEILSKLINDDEFEVYDLVREHPKTPPYLITKKEVSFILDNISDYDFIEYKLSFELFKIISIPYLDMYKKRNLTKPIEELIDITNCSENLINFCIESVDKNYKGSKELMDKLLKITKSSNLSKSDYSLLSPYCKVYKDLIY